MDSHKNKRTIEQKRMDILIRIALLLVIVIVLFFFVVKPMLLTKDYYFEAGGDYHFKNLGETQGEDSYDVVVIGDGVDAISSALGASGVGAKTLLICSSTILGENIRETYDLNWAEDISPTGTHVSSDIFKEIRYKSGETSNIENYIKTLNEMVSDQKLINVIYKANLVDVSQRNGNVEHINIKTPQGVTKIKAKRFIDATTDGQLLKKCNVDYTLGYEEVGLEGLYSPVKLNFMVSGVDYVKLKEFVQKQGTLLNLLIKTYKPSLKSISISGFNISDQGNSSVIIEAITVRNVDLSNSKDISENYVLAKKECEDFYNFLKLNIELFKNAGGFKVADEFISSSPYHFSGKYKILLSDVVTSKRFTDRISTASRPVTLTMEDGSRFILCNPKLFYIPLSSIIPNDLNNVLMVGDKISASPLVQTAINSNTSLIGTGYAAGITAAYSISKDLQVPKIVDDHNLDTQQEIEKVLRKKGIFMSDAKDDESSIVQNWSYPYVEKLNNIGLLAAGITNDFKYDKDAKSQDLAYIILNGVVRVSKDAYSYKFDVTIRPYIDEKPLTRDTFGKMLLELTGKKTIEGNNYLEACNQGLIDEILQQKLKKDDVLKMSEVYYASVQIIEKLTGKTMK